MLAPPHASCAYGRQRLSARRASPMAAQSDSTVHPDDRIDQLTRDLAVAIDQQAATSQVLEVIGRPDFELQPVFETVVLHAVRLCGADAGMVYQLDGDHYRVAYVSGGSEAYRAYLRENPIERGP